MRIGSVIAVTVCACLVAGGIPARAGAQAGPPPIPPDKEPVAVLDLESSGAGAVAGEATEQVRKEWSQSGKVDVVEGDAMRQRFREQGFDPRGCEFIACTVQAGKILGVRKLVTGRVNRIDQTHWELSATLFDVETGDVLRSARVEHEGSDSSLLDQGIKDLVAHLTEVAAAPEEAPAGPSPDEAFIAFQKSQAEARAREAPELHSWKEKWGWGLGLSLVFATGAIAEANDVQQSNTRQKRLVAQSQNSSTTLEWLSYQNQISDQAKKGDQAAVLNNELAALAVISGAYAAYQYLFNKPVPAATSYELLPVPLRTDGYAVLFSATF